MGDVNCAPSLYFPNMTGYCIKKFQDKAPEIKDELVVIGGGGLFHLPAKDYNNGVMQYVYDWFSSFNHIVLWGVGHNIHGETEIKFPDFPDNVHLIGVRDKNTKHRWVPCVSCLHQKFDYEYPKLNSAVSFCHKNSPIDKNIPMMFCEGPSMGQVINFLGSAGIIYTNSYHGLYWGLLLGKTVIVVCPNSSKFYTLGPHEEIRDQLIYHPQLNFLQLCREINNQFYLDVLKLKESLCQN